MERHRATLGLLLLAAIARADSGWSCIPIAEKRLHSGVVWKTQNCTVNPDWSGPPLMVVNSVHVNLTTPSLRLVALAADNDPTTGNASLNTLPGIATQASAPPNLIAGINGGYFWRIDVDGFWLDDVCFGKTRDEAMTPASLDNPNFGVGDGALITDGVLKSSNCDCKGYSRPALLQLAGNHSTIDVLTRGAPVDPIAIPNAIAAGPNLVSWNASTGTASVNIPEGDDNVNRLVYEAGTAAGLVQAPSSVNSSSGATPTLEALEAVLVTVDGTDGCKIYKVNQDRDCGISTRGLGNLMLEIFHATSAMSMDQGGSTTMWVNGEANDGVISRTCENAQCDPRSLANGLFIQALD